MHMVSLIDHFSCFFTCKLLMTSVNNIGIRTDLSRRRVQRNMEMVWTCRKDDGVKGFQDVFVRVCA